MAISIISATFMLSLMAIFAILRIVIEIANTKSGNTTDVGDENGSTKNEEDSLLIDDSTIQEVLQEVRDWENMETAPTQDLQTVEETIVKMTVAKTELAIHWEKYEDYLNLYATDEETFWAIKDEFNAYKLIHAELDKRIDFLLEEYEEKRQNLKELTKSKRCGFHAEKEN